MNYYVEIDKNEPNKKKLTHTHTPTQNNIFSIAGRSVSFVLYVRPSIYIFMNFISTLLSILEFYFIEYKTE